MKPYLSILFPEKLLNQLDKIETAKQALPIYLKLIVWAALPIALFIFFFALIGSIKYENAPSWIVLDLKLDGQTLANYVGIVFGTVVGLVGSLVAIFLALRSQSTSDEMQELQKQTNDLQEEQMRFNATREISEQLSQIFASVAAFDVALDLAFRRSGELANQMMVSMGIAAHDYLRLTAEHIIRSNEEQYRLHDHALLMAQYVRRGDFDDRLQHVKIAIGKMADALEQILENAIAASAYRESAKKAEPPDSSQSSDAHLAPVSPSNLVGVVSLLRNKAESQISDDQLVRMWFLALSPDRIRAENGSFFGENFLLSPEFIEDAVNEGRHTTARSWALLGALIGTWPINDEERKFSNFGLKLLDLVCKSLPEKQSIQEVITRQQDRNKESVLSYLYQEAISSWPYERQNREDLSKSVAEHREILAGHGQGPDWDCFRELAWQFAAARILTDELLLLHRTGNMIKEAMNLDRREDLCGTVGHFFVSALRLYRVPVSAVQSVEIKNWIYVELVKNASNLLEDLIHSPWFRGKTEARRQALVEAEAFFSWLILYKGDDPELRLNLVKITASLDNIALVKESLEIEINRYSRIVRVDQAAVSQSVVARRIENSEPFESVARSFVGLIIHLEELAQLDDDLRLHKEVVQLINALNNLKTFPGFDERCLCTEIVPRLSSWKGNTQLLTEETTEFIDSLDKWS